MNSNTSSTRDYIIRETNPNNPVSKCIIWLHGLGADGHDFEPIVPQLNISDNFNYKFIFPHAPKIPVTLNNGFVMPAWFDIYGISIADQIDRQGIQQSESKISKIIESEINSGTSPGNIILAGFSQGGVMALISALQQPQQLGGAIALSCFLPLADEILQNNQHKLPVFMAHGQYDPVVAFKLGESACKTLQQAGFDVEWHVYPIEHGVCQEEISDIGRWLTRLNDPPLSQG